MPVFAFGYDAAVFVRRETGSRRTKTGDEGIRTLDLRIANAALSQLSYVPVGGREPDTAPSAPPQNDVF